MKRISEDTIQNILHATNIVDVVEGYFPLKRVGGSFRANCPFHTEKTPSFYVNPSRQGFKCFGCGASGTVIRFVMDYENISFQDAMKKLANRAGITLIEEQLDPESEKRLKRRSLALTQLKNTAEFFHELLLNSKSAEEARQYLKSRGFNRETAERWMIGYAPANQKEFFDWARTLGVTGRVLIDAGVASPRDEERPKEGLYARFRDRLIFPILNDYDDVVGFSGRSLDPEAKTAKYLNSPETIVFDKGRLLFGLNKAKRAIGKEKHAILCEGQIDLIAASEKGIENIVAPLGTAFTSEHARMLRRYTEVVVICYDGDAAGVKAAERAQRELAAGGMIVRVAPLPEGDDPDSFIKREGAEAFKARIAEAQDFYDFLLDSKIRGVDLSDVGERTKLARELAGFIGSVSDKMMRESVAHKVATRLTVDDQLLIREVESARRKSKSQEASRAAMSQHRATGEVETEEEPFTIRQPALEMLCHLALASKKGRELLTKGDALETEWLNDFEHGTLLTTILEANIDPDQPASINAWLSDRPVRQEDYLSALLDAPTPPDLEKAVADCLEKVRQHSFGRRILELKSQIATPGISPQAQITLQKEVLDLQKRLKNSAPLDSNVPDEATSENDPF